MSQDSQTTVSISPNTSTPMHQMIARAERVRKPFKLKKTVMISHGNVIGRTDIADCI